MSSIRPLQVQRGAGAVSVEAISWALNLALVPRDRGRKRNPACKAVLVGLANHAAPDGKEAFPSVKTLVRYTDLSERTVQTALDRLEAEGIIRPCDPAIVAAKIKRADRRPQGWDLAMHLVRDDLDDEELAVLERQFPGLTARVVAMQAADSCGPDDAGSAGLRRSSRGAQPRPARGDEADGRTRRIRRRRSDDLASRGRPSALERDLRRRRRGRDSCASTRTRRLGSRRAAECAMGAIRRPRRPGRRVLHRQPVCGGEPLDDPFRAALVRLY